MLQTTSDIENYLQDYKHFLGCFSKSFLPVFPTKFPCGMIINNDNEHWVSLIMCENKCFYFDSFGVESIDEEILKFVQFKYKELFINIKVVQDVSSSNCGKFCIAFIKNVNSEKTYISFFNIFSNILKENDYIVKKYI